MEALTPEHVQTALNALNLGITIRFFRIRRRRRNWQQMPSAARSDRLPKACALLCMTNQFWSSPAATSASTTASWQHCWECPVNRSNLRLRHNALSILVMLLEVCHPLHIATGRTRCTSTHRSNAIRQIYPAGGSSNAIFGVTLTQLAQISSGIFADVQAGRLSPLHPRYEASLSRRPALFLYLYYSQLVRRRGILVPQSLFPA